MSPLPPAPCWPRRDADHLLVSGAQMAALEQQLFASGLPVEALMEKAALAVAERVRTGAAWRRRARRPGRPTASLCIRTARRFRRKDRLRCLAECVCWSSTTTA